MFSRRSDHDSAPNDWSLSAARARACGAELFDLTCSNPTTLDLPLPVLSAPAVSARYEAEPLGLWSARVAVAEDYRREGIEADPERVVLTASTSEGYSFLFKLLTDPGDALLVPQPSYPLFEFLARGEHVSPLGYPLLFDGLGFHYEAALLPEQDARAVIAVSPNHPTGSQVNEAFAHAVLDSGRPLIIDEVFGRFALDREAPLSALKTAPRHGLCVRLCGLSKQLGLPQAKLSWMLLDGEPALVEQALSRLELIADTFLSVGGPVQHALPALLRAGEPFRVATQQRTQANLRTLRAALATLPCSVLSAPAGWVCVVRLPSCDEQALACQLIERAGVLAYPGAPFGFPFPALVLSLLLPPAQHAVACERLATGLAALL